MSGIYSCDPGGSRSYRYRVVDVQLFLTGPDHLRESVCTVLERHPLKCSFVMRDSSLSSCSLFHSLCLPPPPSLASAMCAELSPPLPQEDSGFASSSFSPPLPPCPPLPSLLLSENFTSLLFNTPSHSVSPLDSRDATPELSPPRLPYPHRQLRTPYIPLPGDTTPELMDSP